LIYGIILDRKPVILIKAKWIGQKFNKRDS